MFAVCKERIEESADLYVSVFIAFAADVVHLFPNLLKVVKCIGKLCKYFV